MNCEEMSDFEVNRAVACRLDGNDLDIFCRPMFSIDCYFSIPESSSVNWHRIGYESFNPCNNPSDAWPVIFANRINVYASEGPDFMPWMAGCGGFMASNKKPLRAAMVVFLMMQDEAK